MKLQLRKLQQPLRSLRPSRSLRSVCSVGPSRLSHPLRYLALGAGSLLFAVQVFASTVTNINTADAETIAASLQGIGPVKAQAIVDYREANGLFKAPSDIMNVTGIGKATFELLKSYLVIGAPAKTPAKTPAKSSANEASSSATPVLKPASTMAAGKAVANN